MARNRNSHAAPEKDSSDHLHQGDACPSLKRYPPNAITYSNNDTAVSFEDSKAQDVLKKGLQKELQAENATSQERHQLLLEALQIYNCGCCASELYKKITDSHPDGSNLWLFDRSDWANVFFSAARICTKFVENPPLDKEKRTILPHQLKCEGQLLSSRDWKHQALDFLEQGRARSLLHSISSGSTVTDRERWLIWKTARQPAMRDMRVVVNAAVLSIKKNPSPSILSADDDPMSDKTTQDVTQRKSPVPTLHSRSSSSLDSNTKMRVLPQNNQKIFADMKVQIRWRKAILFARTKNPHIGDVLLGDVEEIRETIPSDTLVVEYALASTPPGGIMTIIASSEGIQKAEWKEIDATNIHNCIDHLLVSMELTQSRPGQSTRAPHILSPLSSRSIVRPSGPQRKDSALRQQNLSDLLSDSVVTPVRPYLAGKNKLIIIPSGKLGHVPWSMFFKEVPVTVVPSLNIWSRLHTQASSSDVPHPKISVVSNAPTDKEKQRRNLPAIRNIPYSRIEALCIARRHQQWPFLADEKDQQEFKTVAEGAHILHLCAHSTFNHNSPHSSSIHLFNEPLKMSDWRGLSIRADLVIFSSCVSSLSKAYASGSAIGFAHTLLATGTKTFIGSLWPVDDQGTLFFMMMFYQELIKSVTAAEALHAAQERMRTLTQDELDDLIDEIEEHATRDEADGFVDNPTYHITQLKRQDVKELAEARYWAAFVLTGYGSKKLYPEGLPT
ncbi:hypothetical protein P280DRAFT_478809 [Massarina eburnea CBS 473.64]|uniref:CHAT domain-containing protein n=1 Tax=Massarina eburnea CBS 473.64 TaxID=1395130 RepID=A0A6A6S564_9PLEO|nr:hypothetical protein P280DRAFT_478809 [Massarina eburnea CBS 473.64]